MARGAPDHEPAPLPRRKKQRVLTEEEQRRVQQLERSLFGTGEDFFAGLGQEEALHREAQAAAEAAALVWEDRVKGEVPQWSEEDSESEGPEAGGDEEPGEPPGSDSDSDSAPLEASSRTPQQSPGGAFLQALAQEGEDEEEGADDEQPGSAEDAHPSGLPAEDDAGTARRRGGEEEEEEAITIHSRRPGAEEPPEEAAAAAQQGVLGGLQPAWEDPETEAVRVNIMDRARTRKLRARAGEALLSGTVYEERLRAQHAKLHPRTEWAALGPSAGAEGLQDGGGDDEGEGALLASAAPLLGRSGRLPPGALETSRLRDANQADPSRAVLSCLQFHPGGQLLLTGGLDKRLRLFRVDGVKNERVQSLFFPDLPIRSAAFVGDGAQVVVTGRRRHCYLYDLGAARLQRVPGLLGRSERSLESVVASPAPGSPLLAVLGNEGCVPLVSPSLRQCVGELQAPGSVRVAAFSPDGARLLTAGGDGVVYTWDVRMRRCLARHTDEGSLGVTALAAGPGGELHATGSGSGAVNLYQQGALGGPGPAKPLRSFLNLTTVIDTLAFSPDLQMLVLASRMKRDALRVVHVASRTVFANWPTSRTPLGHVHSAAFSPQGAFLAIGNAKGRAVLYRLHHYGGGPEGVDDYDSA